MAKNDNTIWWVLGIIVVVLILIGGGYGIFGRDKTPQDYQVGLICSGNDVVKLFNSGKTEFYKSCGSQICKENQDGSVSCLTQNGGNGGNGDNGETICPSGTYLGNNDICFDYPGKNLPQGFDYEQCIESALEDYYNQFGATTYTISWITAKTVEDDQYDTSDIWWKYIGCSSVRESSGAFIKWGVTADCKTGKSGDMLTDSQASNHNICGSERLRG